MTVLLVEPDTLLRAVYSQALEGAGHTVLVAAGAQEAVEMADDHRPDVVVLELQLSGHSGVEFLYEFCSYPEWRSIPIILHTFVPARLLGDVSLLGIVRHLYKPSTPLDQLLQAVEESIGVDISI